MSWKYYRHYFNYAEGHIYNDKGRKACMVNLTGAASMEQKELDRIGRRIVKSLNTKVVK